MKYKDFKAELIEKEKKLLKEKNEKKGIFTTDDDKSTFSFREIWKLNNYYYHNMK